MTWASDPPAVPGVYWWRITGVPTVVLVEPMGVVDAHMRRVDPGTLGAFWPGSDTPGAVADLGGEWWGPLPPPSPGGAVVSDSDRAAGWDAAQRWLDGHFARLTGGDGNRADGFPLDRLDEPAAHGEG